MAYTMETGAEMPHSRRKAMTTATAVLATVPASYRCKRNASGGLEKQLQNLDQKSCDSTVQMLAYGMLWADQTGRISGTISMALRRATPWQAAQLIAAMVRDGLEVSAPVPRWLNANALQLLGAA